MGATKHNETVFTGVITKAKTAIKSEALKRGIWIAEELVKTAVKAYGTEKFSLTGNLLNSIAGGVYIQGRLESIVTAQDKADISPATATYVRIGEGGFEHYITGEPVEGVRQYKGGKFFFQPVDNNMTGIESALEFLMSIRPTKFLEVVICAAAPYAEYLQNTRKLDVLMSASDEAKTLWPAKLKAFILK